MFTVMLTTTELDLTRWVYLDKGRFQFSPTPVTVESRADAERALMLVQDFLNLVPSGHGILLTESGPLGYFHSHYSGPATPATRERLELLQELAVAAA